MCFVLSPRGFTYGGESATLSLQTLYCTTLSCLYKTLFIHSPVCAFCWVTFAMWSCIDLLLVTSMWRSISGDEITWHSFCACAHHGARRRFQQALDLEVSVNRHKSEFEKCIRADRLGIEMVALDFLFCANCLWMHGMGRVSQLDSRLQIAGACALWLSVLL